MQCFKCHSKVDWATVHQCPRCGISGFLRTGTLLKNGEFVIEQPLGKGGFGITYQSRHQRLQMPVAIKEFFPSEQSMRSLGGEVSPLPDNEAFYDKWRERFISEGRVLAQIHHPNVVRAQDVFKENGTAYLVMDLITGKSLKNDLMKAPEGRLSTARVRSVMTQLVAALDAVHARKIYHLDLKPDNVMVTEGERIVLVDFGAARQATTRTDASLSSAQQFTRTYAPPELLPEFTEESTVGPESDLFELGMMLHELLTGKLPSSALARLGKSSSIDFPGLEEPWRRLLTEALEMDKRKRPSKVVSWWEYEQRHREHYEYMQRKEIEVARNEEREQWEQESRRLRKQYEGLLAIVHDLEFREKQAINQTQLLSQEIEISNNNLQEQIERLQELEGYLPLIKILEGFKGIAQFSWGLYLDLIEAVLFFFAGKEWLVKHNDLNDRYVRRVGLVIAFFALFFSMWFLSRQR